MNKLSSIIIKISKYKIKYPNNLLFFLTFYIFLIIFIIKMGVCCAFNSNNKIQSNLLKDKDNKIELNDNSNINSNINNNEINSNNENKNNKEDVNDKNISDTTGPILELLLKKSMIKEENNNFLQELNKIKN